MSTAEWRPADTAPRDGTPILVCISGYDKNDSLWVHGPFTVRWQTYHPNAKGKSDWRDSSGHKMTFTHWAPLPKGPN